MMPTLTYSGTLTVVSCWCGIRCAVPDSLYREAKDNGKKIFCPLGHGFVFTETTVQELEKQLEQAQRTAIRERNWRRNAEQATEDERRGKAAVKGHLTRMRNKIANGVCPVPGCRRHFDNVQAHLASKHEGWLEAHDIEIGVDVAQG